MTDAIRKRMLTTAWKTSISAYTRRVAEVFQRMIRAEAAAQPDGYTPAVVNDEVTLVFRRRGQCVCVTCGKVLPWKGPPNRFGGMHTGHFVASRCNAILFEEANVAPQCAHCNFFQHGAPQRFALWMAEVRGEETIARLQRRKREHVSFTREELVELNIEFRERLKAAQRKMEDPQQ